MPRDTEANAQPKGQTMLKNAWIMPEGEWALLELIEINQ